MSCPMTTSIARATLLDTALAALVLVLAAVPSAWAVTDITDPSLPHTADSVCFDWYALYAPSNVSNDLLGLGYAAWHSGDERTGEPFPHWVQVDFGTPRTVKHLRVMAYSETPESNLRLKDFRFEGSNDGVTYTALHEGLLQYADRHEWQSFYFEGTTGYRYYRLYGLNNWGCYNVCEQMIIEEWEMFESPVGACCFPSGACLEGSPEDCAAVGGAYRGDGVECDPGLCMATAVSDPSWGRMKTIFR